MTMSDSQFYNASDKESIVTLGEWSERHPVDFADVDWHDIHFARFMENQHFPNFLRNEAAVKPLKSRLLKTDYGETGLSFFDDWVEEKTFEDGDRYELEMWLAHIACSWMSSVSKRMSKKSSYACRNGIVNLLELAFQLRAGANQEWQQEAELVLPDEPDFVVADAIAAVPLPHFWQSELRRSYPASWSYSNKPESVITFIFVASKDDSDEQTARERLQMCFYSAQKNRRALCLKDAPVFGATLHDAILDTYVSTWVGDRLFIQAVLQRYTIHFFSDFVEYYFVLCRIEEYTHEFLAGQFEQWWCERRPTKQRLAEACKSPWRSEVRGVVALDVRDNNDSTGFHIDISRLDCVHDRYSRILLASVLQATRSLGTGYQLTRKNKKAFDIIMDLDDVNQYARAPFVPSAWAKDTSKYQDEYEDPAPFCKACDCSLTDSDGVRDAGASNDVVLPNGLTPTVLAGTAPWIRKGKGKHQSRRDGRQLRRSYHRFVARNLDLAVIKIH